MEPRTPTGTTVGLLLVVMLAITACGDGGGSDDVLGLGDRDLDRCSLISAEEAATWLGDQVEDPAPMEGVGGEPDPVTCSYDGSSARVLLQIYDGEVFFAEEGSTSRDGETIEDLGEDAWMRNDKVEFLQNDWSVSIAHISGQVTGEDLLEMAELVSSRLP